MNEKDVSKLIEIKYSINATYSFLILILMFLLLTFLNSGKEMIHPIMAGVMSIILFLSYKKVYYSIDLDLNVLNIKSMIGTSERNYYFDELKIKNNKVYRLKDGSEKKIPSSRIFCDQQDYQKLIDFVTKDFITNRS